MRPTITLSLLALSSSVAQAQLTLFIDTDIQTISFGSTSTDTLTPAENIGTWGVSVGTDLPTFGQSTFWVLPASVLTVEDLEITVVADNVTTLRLGFISTENFSTITGNAASAFYGDQDAVIASLLDSIGSDQFSFSGSDWGADGLPYFSTVPEPSQCALLIAFSALGCVAFRRRQGSAQKAF